MIQATRFWGNNSSSFAISKNNWWDFCQTVNSLKDSILPILSHNHYIPNHYIPAPQTFHPLFIRSQFQSFHGIIDEVRISNVSQSLIHQVSDSDLLALAPVCIGFFLSQSLIHQVSVSDLTLFCKSHLKLLSLNPLFIRSQIQSVHWTDGYLRQKMSQSLIHQVSVSDDEDGIRPGL